MDLKWVNEFYSGCAITINIKFNPGICKDECGLATSSRKVAAKLWNGTVPNYLSPLDAAKSLWGAENFDAAATEERPYWAGSQDHCGLMFAGVNKLCYAGAPRLFQVVSLNDPTDLPLPSSDGSSRCLHRGHPLRLSPVRLLIARSTT